MTCRFSEGAARRELTPVDNLFLTEYMPRASEPCVKVYLYGLLQCYHAAFYEDSVAEALHLSDEAVRQAFLYWQEQGLVRISSEDPFTVEYLLSELPEARESAPVKYRSLVRSLGQLFAPRQLGMRELRSVYDWIEVFGLDEGAALQLASYCLERKGRRCSLSYMTSVAQSWSESGIRTQADAMQYIEQSRKRASGAAAILRAWNIEGRAPTSDELARYEKWTTDWGFSDEAILAALPRVTASQNPNFKYLESVLESLRADGVSTAEAVAGDDRADALERDFAKLLFARAGKVEPATKTQRKQIALFLSDWGMPRELLLYAAERSRTASEPFGQMKKRLTEWHEQGVSTVAAAEAYERTRENAARPAKRAAAGRSYPQRKYSNEDLQHLAVNLDEDEE